MKRIALLALLVAGGWSVPVCASGPTMRSAGGGAVAGPHTQPGGARGFHRPLFFGDGGIRATDVTIQQSQSPPAASPQRPETNRVYVPPRWVDGGYGVQILVPGYWSDSAPGH